MSARSVYGTLFQPLLMVAICLALLVVIAIIVRSPYRTMHVNGHLYYLEIADTDAGHARGLGGRRSLPPSQGMLFVYAQPSRQCFWMKDMHYPLDIVWLSAQQRIVHMEKDVPQGSYPASFCAPGTQYVIELNAGEAARAGLMLGQRITF